MFKKFLSVIFIIACTHPLKSFTTPTSDECHGEWVSIDSLGISPLAKETLKNAGISAKELRLWSEEELLRRFNIDRMTLQEGKEALKILFLSPSKDPEDPVNVFKKLGLSKRATKKLIRANILSVEELTSKTEEEVLRRFDIGPQTLREIKEVFKVSGLSFSDRKDLYALGLSPFERFKRLGLSTKTINKLMLTQRIASDENQAEISGDELLDEKKILTIEELTAKTEEELSRRFDIGPKSLHEIKEALKAKGLTLADGTDLYAPGLSPFERFKRLGLSTITARKLIRTQILSIEGLTTKTEEELSRNFDIGSGTLKEIKTTLKEKGLALSDGTDLYAPGLSPFDQFKRLGLSTITAGKLIQARILSIKALTQKTEYELSNIFDIGTVKLKEIKEALKAKGLALSDGTDLYAPGLSPFERFKRLGLSTATSRKLIRAKIRSIKALTKKTENELRNKFDIGISVLKIIKNKLKARGLALSDGKDLYLYAPELSSFEQFQRLGLSTKTINALMKNGEIFSIEELIQATENELNNIFGIGPHAIQEIKDNLAERGLSLPDKKDPYAPELSPFDQFQRLGLSTKTINSLIQYGEITSIRELTSKTESELSNIFGIGLQAVQNIKDALEEQGLSLHDEKDLHAPGLSPFERFKRLGLSAKTINALMQYGEISSIEDLTHRTENELLGVPDIGPQTIRTIKAKLKAQGLSLANGKITNTQRLSAFERFKQLGLSSRIARNLEYVRIFSVRELISRTENELLKIPGIGPDAIQEIKAKLRSKRLKLSDGKDLYAPGLSSFDQFKRLGLSNTFVRNLIHVEILSIEELTDTTEDELSTRFHFSPKFIQKIKEALKNHGLALSDEESFNSSHWSVSLHQPESPSYSASPHTSGTNPGPYKK